MHPAFLIAIAFLACTCAATAQSSVATFTGTVDDPASDVVSVSYYRSLADYAARIETEFGGVFYLTNLALFLELYGDFTTPLAHGIELPLWDFVALVGHGLCGESIRRDAVWALLAKLADRNMRLTCTIQDSQMWLANDATSVEITPHPLKLPVARR